MRREIAKPAGVRRPKEIIVLLVLLLAAMAFVLGYVIDRRSHLRAEPPPRSVSPGP